MMTSISPMQAMIVVFVGAFVAIAIGSFVLSAGMRSAKARSSRIENIRLRAQTGKVSSASKNLADNSVKRTKAKEWAALSRLVSLMPHRDALQLRLERTGKKIGIGPYIVATVTLVLLCAVAAFVALDVSRVTAVFVGLAVGIGLPHWGVGQMAAKRTAQFNAVFPDAIDLIVRGLKSGLPVGESIAAVAREMPGPVGLEFRHVVDAVKFGQPLEDALWDVARRLSTPEFKFFVISLSVQKDTGGNLGETLENLSEILRKRRQMRLKIRAMSSEAKASAMILGGLPFIMLGLIFLIAPDYEMQLFTDPRGKVMFGAVLGVMSVGILVMRKMVRFAI